MSAKEFLLETQTLKTSGGYFSINSVADFREVTDAMWEVYKMKKITHVDITLVFEDGDKVKTCGCGKREAPGWDHNKEVRQVVLEKEDKPKERRGTWCGCCGRAFPDG